KYTVADAAKAMDVGLSTMTRWGKQLRDERQGKTPKASQARRGDVPQRSGQSLYEQAVPAVIVAIPDQTEYEPARKLLG
ncbi:hypothetical protein DLF58_005115, partial [Escherichia coli O157]|nr:hypothetical protein [Escherichia coli O157]